jgi:nucleotide-binding universal stress UspA family protein
MLCSQQENGAIMRIVPRPVSAAFKTIVVATDFSEFSDHALLSTVGLAEKFKARIILTHVIDPLLYSNVLNGAPFVPKQVEKDVRAQLEASAERVRAAGVRVEIKTCHGFIRESLRQLINDAKADLLVVSTHGEHRFNRSVCSSVAEKILRISPCPVMIMSPLMGAEETDGTASPQLLFATAFATHSDRTLPYADALAHAFGADLNLLHVLQSSNLRAETHREALEKLKRMAKEQVHLTPTVHCLVQAGHLGETIASVARALKPVVTVLGVREEDLLHTPVGGLHHGLVYKIVTQSSFPVLTLNTAVDVFALRATVQLAEMYQAAR